jgi:hypothetical protein
MHAGHTPIIFEYAFTWIKEVNSVGDVSTASTLVWGAYSASEGVAFHAGKNLATAAERRVNERD